jgi:hypothetical protein
VQRFVTIVCYGGEIYSYVPVAERYKARVYGRSLAGIAGSKSRKATKIILNFCELSKTEIIVNQRMFRDFLCFLA